jgi:O-antigen/teichoic acid export membrane protein
MIRARALPTLSPRTTRAIGASGALVAQISQALASFVLQLLAARSLGAAGLGHFALLYGGVVLATAVETGLVGDSLTVLDRQNPRIRSGLQVWLGAVSVTGGVIGAIIVAASAITDRPVAGLFALALAVFMIEDAFRRLLMALLRFWYIILVDLSTLVASVAFLGAEAAAGKSLTLGDFVVALLIGQVAGIAIAIPCLTTDERWLSRDRTPDLKAVFGFGSWRAMQQGLRPAALQIMRSMVLAVAGGVAFGRLEAARVYMAPALLIVQGAGSFLFAMYARTRDQPLHQVLRRADLATMALLVSSVGLGAVAALSAHLLGGLITAGGYTLDRRAVFGWAMFAASSAVALPYASLAAVRGKQARVLIIRTGDSLLSVGLVALLEFGLHTPAWLAPYGLAAGPFVGATIIRFLLLARQSSAEASQTIAIEDELGVANVSAR